MGPLSRAVLWFDMRVVDGVVNGAGLVSMKLASIVRWTDEDVVDGVFNATGAATGASGSVLRRTFTGRVQQYVAFSFIGVIAIAAILIIL